MAERDFRVLTTQELGQLYNERMKEDFPANELKPLPWLIRLTEEGYYEPYGFYRDGTLVAYALFWGAGEEPCVMLDYFAVVPRERNRKVGGSLIKAMAELFGKRGLSVFLETEAPVTGDKETDDLRRRRIAFYERSGCRRVGYTCKAFGVPYIVMTFGPEIGEEELMKIHRRIYHSVLDDKLYEQNILIPEEL